MASRGYPAACEPEYAELARKFCVLGATSQELAEQFAGEAEHLRPAAEVAEVLPNPCPGPEAAEPLPAERIDDCVAGTAADQRGWGHSGQNSLLLPPGNSATATAERFGPKCPKCPKFDDAGYVIDSQAFSAPNFGPIRLA